MAQKIKEYSVKDLKQNYSNQSVLTNAFSQIKNATIVQASDNNAVILDEENQIFYEIDYSVDKETGDLLMKNFMPVVIKEEKLEVKELYAKAMNEDIATEDALTLARQIARYHAKKYVGGERERMIKESRLKSILKKIDKGRKQIIEDLNLFKSINRKLINEIKVNGFYDRFAEKINSKYMKDGAFVTVEDKINFNLVDRRSKSKNISETIFRKKLSETKTPDWFNPVDVVKNSPSFIGKLNKFMDDVLMLKKSGRDEKLTESQKVFAKFASNWPVLYTVSEQKHKDFAIKHFSNYVSDPVRAKEYIDSYNTLISGEQFKKDQKEYLSENYKITPADLQSKKLSESIYNARIVDDAKKAVELIRSKVEKIESFNVENYLRFAEEKLNEMIRTGKFNEELFEQIVVDIFGDSKLVNFNENDVFDDEDFKNETKSLTESEIKAYELEEKAYRLILELRELIPSADKSVKTNLEEDLDLLKSMSAVASYDEQRLSDIEKMVESLKGNKSEDEVSVIEEKLEAYCPDCHSDVTVKLTEAKADEKETFACPSCKTELAV